MAKINKGLRATGEYLNLGLDTKIQLQLAQFDNNCNPFSGIVRINASSVANYSNGFSIYDETMMDDLQALVPNYLDNEVIKIFVVDNFIEYSGWGNWWGTMIVNQYVARNASELLIHEIGHTFSLAHTFQSDNGQCAPNSDPDNQGDYISDTDPHLENDYCIYKSPTAINTCTELPFGNVLKNFMSYSWSCIDRFTPKQVERMRNGLVTIRPKWINSKFLTGTVLPPIANSITRCLPGSVSLTASGCSGTYNWYSSISGGSSLGNGSTFNTPTISNTNTYYVSCTEGNCVSARTAVQAIIKLSLDETCYCVPELWNNNDYTDITSVSIGNLTNSSTCSTTGPSGSKLNKYSNYTNLPIANFTKGSNLAYSINTTTCNGSSDWHTVKVYIDFNRNGSYDDDGEKVVTPSVISSSSSTFQGDFVIPNTVINGTTYMRIICADYYNYNGSSCSGYAWGETEDYKINIVDCTPPGPPITSSLSRCGTGTVMLTSSGCSGTYNWYLSSSGGASLATTANYTTPSISSTTSYYVNCSVGGCTSSRTMATATIIAIPPAPTLLANPANISPGQSSTLSASNCSGTLTWSNGLGTGSSKIVSPIVTTTYTATCTVNDCTSSNGSVTVTVSTCNLSAPTTTSANRCGTGTVTLSASSCSGTYNWYAVSSDGTSLASTANYTTQSISLTTNYYVSCTVGSCTSSRTVATGIIKAIPAAPTLSASPATITSGQSSTLSASNCSGNVTWSNSLGTGTSKSVSPSVTTTYTGTCIVNGCTSTNGSVMVTVNSLNPCPNTITHIGNVVTGTYSSAQTINSSANVATNTNYYAGNSITMNPGFSAGGNETFIAKIQNCFPAIPTSGMVVYLPFNNNLNDESGNGNNGEFHGGKYTIDRFGNDKKSIYFGGTEISQGYTGYAIIPNSNSLLFTSDFSISIWVSVKTYFGMSLDNNGYLINSQDGIQTLFSKGGFNTGFIANIIPKSSVDSVFYGFKNDISFGVNNFELIKREKGVSNTINNWIHLTYVIQSSILKLYKNGALINSKVVNSPIDYNVMNSNSIRLGVVPPGEGYFPLNGSLDDLRIYNRALSDSEVQSLYNAEKP
ncbi:MAG: hypothetical protein IPP61_18885 [Cytophagaceae bacterium]|nr:hypothetical protein [Cytophagaceae bacterium]MBL0327194.1 hypothetical protein [Cytophagaceae bacterium]